ncbi:MAG: hypothetical protein ACKVTZ_15055, partial [Bacteroidia bacterium]
MKHIILLFSCFYFLYCPAFSQTNPLIINQNISLPSDSLETKQFLSALNGFLLLAQRPAQENTWIVPNADEAMYLLLDEMQEIEQSTRFKDNYFYKPYLTNLTPLPNGGYQVQISYIGIQENKA